YAPPAAEVGEGETPAFAASLEVADAPWAPTHRLVRIGLKSRETENSSVGQIDGERVTVAEDVMIQVEFNPATVASYRLIGYENRLRPNEDFPKDARSPAGIGAGQSVTALYEIVPTETSREVAAAPTVDVLENQVKRAVSAPRERPVGRLETPGKSLLTVKVRYKKPATFISKWLEFSVVDSRASFATASADFRFAAAVAQFGMVLRNSPHRGQATLAEVVTWAATAAAGPAGDPGGHRGKFIDLVRKTQRMLR
ncbi:MAG: DUF3520 domain-containing protein, partial [Opitutus sp.]|nr:DUF3520 domain-containing protein [Opitutus sp.]